MNTGFLTALLALLAVFAVLVLLAINRSPRQKTSRRRPSTTPPPVDYRSHWRRVEDLMSQPGLESTKAAIFEADKLVDQALLQHRIPGETMGERLRNARSRFSDNQLYQDLWQAHKTRNALAHELGFDLPKSVATSHIAAFKSSLRHLGVL